MHSLSFNCVTTNSVPGENVIGKKEVKVNKEPDMKKKSQYACKTLQLEGRQSRRAASFVGLGLDTKTAFLSQGILKVTAEFG